MSVNIHSDVDSKSWRQVDLEEKIRKQIKKISNIQQLMETKSDNKISAFLNLSVSIAVLEGAKQKLQKILISLLTFNAVSPTIFFKFRALFIGRSKWFCPSCTIMGCY